MVSFVYFTATEFPILYVPLAAFLRPNVTLTDSVLNFPPAIEIVGVGEVFALYTTAIPVSPILPESLPPDTVNVLPVISSVYVPSATFFTSKSDNVLLPPDTWHRTTPYLPSFSEYLMLKATPSEEPRYSFAPTK